MGDYGPYIRPRGPVYRGPEPAYTPDPCEADCEASLGLGPCTCGADDRCAQCGGEGSVYDGPWDVVCAECDGEGRR